MWKALLGREAVNAGARFDYGILMSATASDIPLEPRLRLFYICSNHSGALRSGRRSLLDIVDRTTEEPLLARKRRSGPARLLGCHRRQPDAPARRNWSEPPHAKRGSSLGARLAVTSRGPPPRAKAASLSRWA